LYFAPQALTRDCAVFFILFQANASFPDVFADAHVVIDPYRQHIELSPFVEAGWYAPAGVRLGR